MFLGDVCGAEPFETLALAGPGPGRSSAETTGPVEATRRIAWPAAAAVAGFVWLELAYHAPTTRGPVQRALAYASSS